QLLRAAARKISIPVGYHQQCAAGPTLAAAVREAQPAGAASQIDERVAREDKTPELFDGIADHQRVRKAASSGIADAIRTGVANHPDTAHIDVTDGQHSTKQLVVAVNLRSRLDKAAESKRIADGQYAAGLEDAAAVRDGQIRTGQRATGQVHRGGEVRLATAGVRLNLGH